jgi:prephenate dehydrogenase
MDLLVVGAGAMGRWVAETVGTDVAVTDRDPAVAQAAAAAVGGRAVALDTDETFTAVCLAVPMAAIEDAAREHAPKAERAVFDVTGTMERAVTALAAAAPDAERVSLHPLFAPENAPGNVAVVADAPGPTTDTIRERLTDAGNDVFETTVAEHDRAMATVQAGAHTAVLAFALAAADVRPAFHTPISGPLADLAATVTGGNPDVYADIQDAFDGAEAVAEAATAIADADRELFRDLYRQAAENRPAAPGDEDTS